MSVTPRRRAALVVALLLLMVLVAQLALFVLPAGSPPRLADAVVVLAGPGDRLEKGEELVAQGYSEVLVLATDTPDNCSPDAPREQICFEPEPSTTRGEAREVARLARSHGWDSLLVVAQNEQAYRARLRLERCLGQGVDLTIVTIRASVAQSVFRTVYETGALPKALIAEHSC